MDIGKSILKTTLKKYNSIANLKKKVIFATSLIGTAFEMKHAKLKYMKQLLLLLALTLSVNAIQAQNSSVTIFSEDGDEFYLFLNGVRQNPNPATNIKVDFLTNEYYNTKVVFASETKPLEIEKKTLMVVDVDGNRGDMTYVIKQNRRGKYILRYYSFTEYQQAPVVADEVTVVKYSTVPLPAISTTTTTTTTTTTGNGSGDNVNVGINVGGVNIGMDVNINEGQSSQTTTTTTTTTTTGSTGTGADVIIVDDTPDCYTLSDSDFDDALSSIEGKSFSDSKLTLAKQVVKRNCLTAQQIKKITLLFDFESTKLEFAKYAYPYCYNPENYWKINDAFDFESTIEELNEYIERQ